MAEDPETDYLERIATEVRSRHWDLPTEVAEVVVQAAVSIEKDNLEGVGVLAGYVNERQRRKEAAESLGELTVHTA